MASSAVTLAEEVVTALETPTLPVVLAPVLRHSPHVRLEDLLAQLAEPTK
jgi:hypothetical protein